MKINSKTTLKQIKDMMYEDFSILVTTFQAKQIKSSVRDGVAVWTGEKYVTTRSSDAVNAVYPSGVKFSAYRTHYTPAEWNRGVKDGEFK